MIPNNKMQSIITAGIAIPLVIVLMGFIGGLDHDLITLSNAFKSSIKALFYHFSVFSMLTLVNGFIASKIQ